MQFDPIGLQYNCLNSRLQATINRKLEHFLDKFEVTEEFEQMYIKYLNTNNQDELEYSLYKAGLSLGLGDIFSVMQNMNFETFLYDVNILNNSNDEDEDNIEEETLNEETKMMKEEEENNPYVRCNTIDRRIHELKQLNPSVLYYYLGEEIFKSNQFAIDNISNYWESKYVEQYTKLWTFDFSDIVFEDIFERGQIPSAITRAPDVSEKDYEKILGIINYVSKTEEIFKHLFSLIKPFCLQFITSDLMTIACGKIHENLMMKSYWQSYNLEITPNLEDLKNYLIEKVCYLQRRRDYFSKYKYQREIFKAKIGNYSILNWVGKVYFEHLKEYYNYTGKYYNIDIASFLTRELKAIFNNYGYTKEENTEEYIANFISEEVPIQQYIQEEMINALKIAAENADLKDQIENIKKFLYNVRDEHKSLILKIIDYVETPNQNLMQEIQNFITYNGEYLENDYHTWMQNLITGIADELKKENEEKAKRLDNDKRIVIRMMEYLLGSEITQQKVNEIGYETSNFLDLMIEFLTNCIESIYKDNADSLSFEIKQGINLQEFVKQLQDLVKSQSDTITTNETKISTTEALLKKTQTDLQTKETELTNTKQDLETKETELNNLQIIISKTQEDINNNDTNLTETDKIIKVADKVLGENLPEDIKALKQIIELLRNLQKDHQKRKDDYEENTKLLSGLQQTVETLKQQAKEKQKEIEKLNESLTEYFNKLEENKTTINKIKTDNYNKNILINEQNSKIKEQETEIEELNSNIKNKTDDAILQLIYKLPVDIMNIKGFRYSFIEIMKMYYPEAPLPDPDKPLADNVIIYGRTLAEWYEVYKAKVSALIKQEKPFHIEGIIQNYDIRVNEEEKINTLLIQLEEKFKNSKGNPEDFIDRYDFKQLMLLCTTPEQAEYFKPYISEPAFDKVIFGSKTFKEWYEIYLIRVVPDNEYE